MGRSDSHIENKHRLDFIAEIGYFPCLWAGKNEHSSRKENSQAKLVRNDQESE